MNTLLLMIVLAGVACAGPLLTVPVLTPDSQSLSTSAPGLGQNVLAIAGSSWLIGFNDNVGNDAPGHNGDFDFNDAWLTVTFPVLPSGMAMLNFLAVDSADDNDVRLGTSGTWLEPGQTMQYSVPLNGLPVTI